MKKALITYIAQPEHSSAATIYGHAFVSGNERDWEWFIKSVVHDIEDKNNWEAGTLNITSFTKLWPPPWGRREWNTSTSGNKNTLIVHTAVVEITLYASAEKLEISFTLEKENNG